MLVVVDRPTTRGARGARPGRRTVAGVPVRTDAEGVRAHGEYDDDDRDDAGDGRLDGDGWRRPCSRATPDRLGRARKIRDLRYGENPHQKAAWVRGHGAGLGGAGESYQGKELSYTNLLDLDAAARIALEFTEPAAVVIKHTNPCGVAIGEPTADAYVRARDADPLSAFGGIVGLNRPIDVGRREGDRRPRSSRP